MTQSTSSRSKAQKVVIVTGLSGAGKSTALKVFEDLGYEAVDNLPVNLLRRLVRDDDRSQAGGQPLAVGMDSRTRAFDPGEILGFIHETRETGAANVELLFMECDDPNLVRRFSETRRRHPLALDRPVEDGISAERLILRELKEAADVVLDTSGNTVHETRTGLHDIHSSDRAPQLTIVTKSFGYGRGLPRDADLVLDVRFLRNPHYVEVLRPLTGTDERVAGYIREDPNYDLFLDRFTDLITALLPLYRKEGKAYLTIAFGCTGGRHRSVATAEAAGKLLESEGYRVNIVHRDADLA